jgi:hypothetical protein
MLALALARSQGQGPWYRSQIHSPDSDWVNRIGLGSQIHFPDSDWVNRIGLRSQVLSPGPHLGHRFVPQILIGKELSVQARLKAVRTSECYAPSRWFVDLVFWRIILPKHHRGGVRLQHPPKAHHIRPYSRQVMAEDTQMKSWTNEVYKKHQEVSS